MRTLLVIYVLLLQPVFCLAGKIAVWDPQKGTSEMRFTLEPTRFDEVAQWMQQGGIEVERLTADQIASGKLSADVYDGFVLIGNAVPRDVIKPLKAFSDAGGVLIDLEASIPFLIAIAPNPDGSWTMSPKQPTFAWQTNELLEHFGLQYIHLPRLHDAGVRHEPTSLLKRYLPDAPEAIPTGKRTSRWVVPHKRPELRGTYYPLIRSWRADGMDAVPQIAIVERNGRRAIVTADPVFTRGSDANVWNTGRQTVVALARVASDLRHGKLTLSPEQAIALDPNQPEPEPLAHRLVTGAVSPAGATPVVRFGKFDGSSLEHPTTGDGRQLVRRLDPGQQVTLDVPAKSGQPFFLRARVAFLKTGAVLHASVGGRDVIRERFTYFDVAGETNYQAPGLLGVAAETQRVAFIGNEINGPLVIRNAGAEPLWFDAVQIETRETPARPMMIGLGAGYEAGTIGQRAAIPREVSSRWPRVRGNARLQYVGPPGDPKRWDEVDTILNAQFAMSDHLEVIIEGTPEWAAISPERYELGKKIQRARTVPPDPQKYATIVKELCERYGDRIDSYEIWNEANIQQYWRGTPEEFATLHNVIVETIRKYDPTATIIAGGMAGVDDTFFETLHAAGCWSNVDQIAIHPYAGTSPSWDIVYGQLEGTLYAHGIATQIYSNESGFPAVPTEWFAKAAVSPAWQAMMLDKAMSRLLAGDVTRLNVFHAGGGQHPFGLFDAQGKPRPAYAVFNDYLQLALNGGRQLAVALLPGDDAPIDGIFTAAAVHDDGRITVIANPSLLDDLRPTERAIRPIQFASLLGWTAFFGKARVEKGDAILVPDAGKTMGFYAVHPIDASLTPALRVTVKEAAGALSLVAVVEGKEYPLSTALHAGANDVAFPPDFPRTAVSAELKFRATGPATIDRIDYLDAAGQVVNRSETIPPRRQSVPVLLRIPVSAEAYILDLQSERPTPQTPKVTIADGVATIAMDLTSRTVLRLTPAK